MRNDRKITQETATHKAHKPVFIRAAQKKRGGSGLLQGRLLSQFGTARAGAFTIYPQQRRSH